MENAGQFSQSDNGFNLVFVPSTRRLVQNHAGAAVPVVSLRDPSKLYFVNSAPFRVGPIGVWVPPERPATFRLASPGEAYAWSSIMRKRRL